MPMSFQNVKITRIDSMQGICKQSEGECNPGDNYVSFDYLVHQVYLLYDDWLIGTSTDRWLYKCYPYQSTMPY